MSGSTAGAITFIILSHCVPTKGCMEVTSGAVSAALGCYPPVTNAFPQPSSRGVTGDAGPRLANGIFIVTGLK